MFQKLFGFIGFIFLVSLVGLVSCASAFEIPRFYGQEVVITALRLPQLNTESPWNVDVISKEALNGKTNLGEALRSVPGIDIKSSGYLGSVASARLRGSTSQQVLVLIDGKRINSPLLGMIDLGDVLFNNVDKIEVARAPLSALYGSDAIGGVINVITKKKESAFSLSSGSYNTQKAGLSLGGTSFSLVRSDGFRQNGDYAAQEISQNLGWDLPGMGKVGLDLAYYNSDKGVPGVPNSPLDPLSASTPGDRQKDQNLFTGLSLKRSDGELETEAKIYYNNYYEYSHSYNFYSQLFENSDFRTEQKVAEVTQSRDFTRNLSLLHGIEAREDSGRSTYAGSHVIDNCALYGQMQFNQEKFDLVMGGRIDDHSAFGAVISPRIGANIKLADDLIFRASAGSAFKAPTLNDLFYNNSVWQMYGNPSLSPERSRSVEMGLDKSFGKTAKMSLRYFSTSITDLILWDYDSSTYITRVKNVGAVEVRGGEAELQYHATPLLNIFAGCTLQRSQDTNDINPAYIGKDAPYSPGIKYNVGVEAAGAVRVTAAYIGPRFVDGANAIKLSEYTLVNVWAGREFGNYSLSLNIDNLFDQDYYETVGYHPVTFDQLGYPMPGRVMTVSIGGKI